ncbi:hypothetical protein AVEN_161786-1 [Araneus ventricosus]|uniref:Alpha-carbonic anhydrase domain-containing protein n=1 Tax=Araneus ventricosus TaxID=182803 RepID=A0A4Y2PT30_ARAVE|nr:hypothetical protein AVEN_161786-1 [Araneus ventricosus]
MHSRALLLIAGAVILPYIADGAVIDCAVDDTEPWSYHGKTNGPSAWGETYPSCYGSNQSPIAIKTGETVIDADAGKLEMKNYGIPITKATIINNGHSDAVLIYSLRQAVTSHGVFSYIQAFLRKPFPNKDIEKRVAFSGIIDLSPRSPNLSPSSQNDSQVRPQGQGSRKGRCPSLHTYPCKTPFPTVRLARQESDITSLQQYYALPGVTLESVRRRSRVSLTGCTTFCTREGA